jgi:tetratricopeptide (TPR) repeat protein
MDDDKPRLLVHLSRALVGNEDVELRLLKARTLHALGRPKDAMRDARISITHAPAELSTLVVAGALADVLDDGTTALRSYGRALSVDRRCIPALAGRAKALSDSCRFAEAARDLRKAAALSPESGPLLSDLATVSFGLGDRHSTVRSARHALAIDDHPAATWELGQALGALEDYAAGLPLMEQRWQLVEFCEVNGRDFPWPRWDGAIRPGLRLLLWVEQGFGDALNFVRYAPLLAAQGMHVTVEAPASLEDLFRSLGVEVVRRGAALPGFDVQAPVMSLPALCHTRIETIPAAVPYLFAPSDRRARWRERLASFARPRIGLCWQGNPAFRRDLERSPGFDAVRPLLERRPMIGLVRDLRPGHQHPNLTNLGPDFADFADTAACLEELDLVVTSDTALAHLAGALARPTFLLLHHAPDWRWHEDRNDSPWYPTMRLFRQTSPGDWKTVIDNVSAALP